MSPATDCVFDAGEVARYGTKHLVLGVTRQRLGTVANSLTALLAVLSGRELGGKVRTSVRRNTAPFATSYERFAASPAGARYSPIALSSTRLRRRPSNSA